jgi:7,8-dihydropterin-6-yl-methyl-4-(beta-D-ribofuranosyl)aminobenzene 5'-phosphate synthase
MAGNKITVKILVDNKAIEGLRTEHGFSALIEASGRRILFDTGQATALLHNSSALGCDLSLIDVLILSHGHYDHTGGVAQILRQNSSLKIYCHARVVQARYSIREGADPREISMPAEARTAILNLPAERVCWCSHPERIYSGAGVSGPIPAVHPLERTGAPFFLDPEGMHPDFFEDEQALWVQSERGLVIMTGCCHSGLISTVNHVRRISDQQNICAVIGGFHLKGASRQRLEATAQALSERDIEAIIPCHCTGDEAVDFLRNRLGEKVIPGYAGLEWKTG